MFELISEKKIKIYLRLFFAYAEYLPKRSNLKRNDSNTRKKVQRAVLVTSFYLSNNYFNFRPTKLVAIVVKTTILIELKGIKTAAITGANCPVTAKYNPITL